MASKPPMNFAIENNIIKGEEKILNTSVQNNGQLILKILDDNPNHIGQIEVETGLETTYAEMREACVRCALWLEKQGLGSGDVVAVCTPLQPMDYIPVIGSIFAGAVYNPWHNEVALKTARHLANLTQPKIFFCSADSLEVLRKATKLEGVEARFVSFERCAGAAECLADVLAEATGDEVRAYKARGYDDPNALAMIMFSSGTTGLPKGVMYSSRTLGNFLGGMSIVPAAFRRPLWYSSLYWISGTFCILQAIAGVRTRILHAGFEPEATCRVIEKFKVDWFFIAPSLITHFCKAGVLDRYKLESVKFFVTGGAKLAREFIDKIKQHIPGIFFMQAYGMTESGGVLTVQSNECTKEHSVGFVCPNTLLKVADETSGKALGPNEPGEICFKTSNVMLGYYKNPKATKEMIDDEGWYHTGDRGYYLENGEVMVIDRLKEVMKFRGHQISAFEIEEYLMGHVHIIEAAVVPVPHELDIEIPMAFIKKVPGSKLSEEEIIKLSCDLGDTRKLRAGVQFVNELPYTPSGKVNRKLLKEMAQACKR